MHDYSTADLKKYARDLEASLTTPTSDPDGPALTVNLDDPTHRVSFCIYAWIIGELANIREQLDRIEASKPFVTTWIPASASFPSVTVPYTPPAMPPGTLPSAPQWNPSRIEITARENANGK